MPAIGPDAVRYLRAANREPVTRPFHLRVALPRLCGTDLRNWWAIWFTSWVVLAVSTAGWALARGLDYQHAAFAVILLCGLPGILGPKVSVPVQVDLPATALAMLGVAFAAPGYPMWIVVGVLVIAVGASVRETVPVWAALWLWSPWPLIALIVPLVISRVRKPATESGVPEWDWIAKHPISAGLKFHHGRWRDARLMVIPWGVCLVALFDPSWQLALVVGLAYAQLLIATDSVRLYQHAAGPLMAITAAALIPGPWLLPAAVLHIFWLVTPERI